MAIINLKKFDIKITMKRLALLAFSAFLAPLFSSAQAYEYTVKVNGFTDTVLYMANYYGAKQYYNDTAYVNKNGEFVFSGPKAKIGGIYSVIFPDKKSYFEFILNEPKFKLETNFNDLIGGMKVTGSEENKAFYEYLNFITNKQKGAQPLQQKLESASDSEKEAITAELEQIDNAVKEYQSNFISTNGNLFAAKLMKATMDIEIPEAPKNADGSIDSTFQFKYYKNHYLDNIDFADDRMLYTPVLHSKMDYYIKKLTLQVPDSINKAADYIVGLTKGNKETYKYVVHTITNEYEKSKIMGMDAVFVHMAENYYMDGKAFWMDSTKMEKVNERVTHLKPLLIGNTAPNLVLMDTTGKWIDLSKISADYTILYFWDSGCGHCKKATPKLREAYNNELKAMNVEIYAVGTELENSEWKKFIRENKLNWINVSDSPEVNKNPYPYLQYTTVNSLNFRDIYDIFSTPQVFVLDKDKKIIAKKLGVEQIAEFLTDYSEAMSKK